MGIVGEKNSCLKICYLKVPQSAEIRGFLLEFIWEEGGWNESRRGLELQLDKDNKGFFSRSFLSEQAWGTGENKGKAKWDPWV